MGRRLTKKQQRQINKTIRNNWKVVVVILLLVVLLGVLAYFMGWLDILFKQEGNPAGTDGGYSTTGGASTGGGGSGSVGGGSTPVMSTEVDTLRDLKVNFIDVGQGDCIIIELPDGKNMIIDSGEYSYARDNITAYTTANSITRFDYLLLTHQDSDHAGNIAWVIDTYEIGYIFRPNNYSSHADSAQLPADFNTKTEGGYESSTKTYSKFMISAYNEGCTVEVFDKNSDFSNNVVYNGSTYTYKFDFLTPTANSDSEIVYSDANNYSPVLMLEYASKRVMLTGDAELENLGEYVETYGDNYNVDVLKVGHHGSSNATTSAFIQAIDPEYAIIQCGKDNKYNHPHRETLDVLQGHDGGIEVYRNDTNGKIVLSIDRLGAMEFTMDNTDTSRNFTAGADMIWLHVDLGGYKNVISTSRMVA